MSSGNRGWALAGAVVVLVLVAAAAGWAVRGDTAGVGASGGDVESAYLEAVDTNYAYLLIDWGNPDEETLLAVGREVCASARDEGQGGGAIGVADRTVTRLGAERGSTDFEMVVYLADEALTHLCPDVS